MAGKCFLDTGVCFLYAKNVFCVRGEKPLFRPNRQSYLKNYLAGARAISKESKEITIPNIPMRQAGVSL